MNNMLHDMYGYAQNSNIECILLGADGTQAISTATDTALLFTRVIKDSFGFRYDGQGWALNNELIALPPEGTLFRISISVVLDTSTDFWVALKTKTYVAGTPALYTVGQEDVQSGSDLSFTCYYQYPTKSIQSTTDGHFISLPMIYASLYQASGGNVQVNAETRWWGASTNYPALDGTYIMVEVLDRKRIYTVPSYKGDTNVS